ncbi:uncharacterized protein UV8b_07720 [Ustilaginoidea virens]|uniref:Uncharacterized protein n=1 Tax=Ustilaginoidea virens TaxID=1159556 RepID=A0A8E5HXJ2_USTVR|nr:uncharacterized protein UV8b_07720 [Ustilaginoidea virens]QUC23479.1 hypothetical protein UV8b_07720 [Ustilaginoidea virens]
MQIDPEAMKRGGAVAALWRRYHGHATPLARSYPGRRPPQPLFLDAHGLISVPRGVLVLAFVRAKTTVVAVVDRCSHSWESHRADSSPRLKRMNLTFRHQPESCTRRTRAGPPWPPTVQGMLGTVGDQRHITPNEGLPASESAERDGWIYSTAGLHTATHAFDQVEFPALLQPWLDTEQARQDFKTHAVTDELKLKTLGPLGPLPPPC